MRKRLLKIVTVVLLLALLTMPKFIYVGMGLAYSQLKGNGAKSDWQVVPQYMLGLDLSLPLIPVAGGIEYRYMDTKFDGKDFGDNGIKTKVHTVMMKGRFHF